MRLRQSWRRKVKTKSNFVQLVIGQGIIALDATGNCWMYMGREYGWSPMNMRKLTKEQAERAWNHKKENDWEDFNDSVIDGCF